MLLLLLLLISLSPSSPSETPLLLSKYLNSGQISLARQLSLVRNLTLSTPPPETNEITKNNIISFSGLITVDENCGSHIFFWFFPAQDETNSPKTTPLLLWHGGGPGSSGLSGLFTEHGPYFVTEQGGLGLRALSWTAKRSVIYVDSPVGTGFSYSTFDNKKDSDCIVRSSTKTAEHMRQFMLQFYTMFPEFSESPLYLISGSYGGKFLPAIACDFHTQNLSPTSFKFPLKGLLISSGFTDPISQIDYGDFYYNYGLIDEKDRDYFKEREALAKANIVEGNWTAAFDVIEPLIIGLEGSPSVLRTLTGIQFPYNLARLDFPSRPPELRRHEDFLNLPHVRDALHVSGSGGLKRKNYTISESQVYDNFKEDIYQSVKPQLETLLDSNYKLLFISNQFDLIVPHSTMAKFLSELSWECGQEFRGRRMKGWTRGRKSGFSFLDQDKESTFHPVDGYMKQVKNCNGKSSSLSYLMLRNSGHLWVFDRPEVAFDIVMDFTSTL